MTLHIDSWPWKIALVLAIIGVREFVRLLAPKDSSGATGENGRWAIETLDSAAIAIGLVLFIIQPFLLQAFFIPSGSMENTLQVRDRLLVSKLLYRLRTPQFQEIVVFRAPNDALGPSTPEGTDFIKRCMGTPGDVVYVQDRQMYHIPAGQTRARRVTEPYTKWSPTGSPGYDMKIIDGVVYSREYEAPAQPGIWRLNGIPLPERQQDEVSEAAFGPIPTGQFLMLGDHRNNSNDSHVWGFVPRENIVGKAVCVFWPPTRLSLVEHLSRSRDGDILTAEKPALQSLTP